MPSRSDRLGPMLDGKVQVRKPVTVGALQEEPCRSRAIRFALVQAADRALRGRAFAEEVAALEADEADLSEMRAVAEMMDELRAPW